MTARRPRAWLRLLPFFLVGGGVGVLAGRLLGHAGGGGPIASWAGSTFGALSAWDLVGIVAVYYASVIVHECGHLAGGLVGGSRFLMITAGPVRVSRGRDGLHVEPFLRAGGFAGVTVMLPDAGRPMRPQLLPLIAGGPVASVLLTAAGVAVATGAEGRIAAYGALFALVSGFICLVTLVPMRVQGFMNDAAQFIEQLRGGSRVEFRQALLALAGTSIAGTRPRDWDATSLARAFALDDGGNPLNTLALHQLAAMAALDRGELATARPHLDAIAGGIDAAPQGMRQLFVVFLARTRALHEGDASGARRWLDQGRGGLVEASERAAAEAAVAGAEGDATAARAALARAEATLGKHYDAGAAHLLSDELARIRARLDGRFGIA